MLLLAIQERCRKLTFISSYLWLLFFSIEIQIKLSITHFKYSLFIKPYLVYQNHICLSCFNNISQSNSSLC